jgi:predicted amidohydrolase YtcJ
VRLPGGEPSGVFKDNAQDLISRVIPPLSPEQEERQALFPEFGFCDH